MKDYKSYLFPAAGLIMMGLAIYLIFTPNWIIGLIILSIILIQLMLALIVYMNYLWWPQSTWIDRSLVDIRQVEVPSGVTGVKLQGLIIRDKKVNPSEKQVGILFHHGYKGHKENYFQYYIPLALNGATILCIDARGHGKSKNKAFSSEDFPEILTDVKLEIDFLEKLDNVDPNKLIMMGHSMGGTASLTSGYQDKRIKKIVGLSTPHDHLDFFKNNKTFTTRIIKRGMLKKTGGKYEEWNKTVSAKYHVENSPDNKDRVYLVHAKQDDLIPFSHALKLKQDLHLPDDNVLFLEKPDYKYWMSAHNLVGQATIISDFLVKIVNTLKKS